MSMSDEEYAALWAEYDRKEAEWRARWHQANHPHSFYGGKLEPAPSRPMLSRRHVREAAARAYLDARARGMTAPECTGAAVLATLALEPRWGAADALAHFRRFVLPRVA